ncbi:MAG TPA: hypothetical protein DIT55_04800, partial [Spirochaetaceae bacterium]|nr:hypothetical protein [Spirochaetaceae bacterium]
MKRDPCASRGIAARQGCFFQSLLNRWGLAADTGIGSMMNRISIRTLTACVLLALALPAFAQNPLTHTLAKGETLYAISRKYKVSYEALAAANGITDPTKLRIGTILIIPSVHTAVKGETLYGIAKLYGV